MGLLCLWLWRSWILAFFLVLLLFPGFSLQQTMKNVLNVIYLNCLHNSTTSLSSTFTRNLNITLTNFTSLSLEGTRYAIARPGSSSLSEDQVYAVFECRGDLTLQSCGECMQNATTSLPKICPESVGARIRMEGCFLRYDNQSFFTLDTTYVKGLCNTRSTSDLVAIQTIATQMENVTSDAPRRGSLFFSTRSNGMYAAAQCLCYLSQLECARCLSSYSYRQLCTNSTRLGAQVHLASCDFRYEAYNFLESLSPASPAPAPSPSSDMGPVAASSPSLLTPQTRTGSKTPVIVASVIVGIIAVVGALCGMLVWRYKAVKKEGLKRLKKTASWPRQLLQSRARGFSLEELDEATGHFNPTNKVGEGGFGIVYKGTLSNGERVAIKKLSVGSQQGKEEFLNEVNLITSVQHRNLIRLLGCCVEDSERILVYEYLPNKSLDFHISGANTVLNWSTRYSIIIGMAKGLAYLHEASHVRIIHRDIKPSNILLDDQLNPVIADFGLARLVMENATHVNTGLAGTRGYLAPEYALCGTLSEKVDVFSFGLVSLEVITGKQNAYNMLLTWVWEKYRQEKVLDLVDERLANIFSPKQAIRGVHVALLCTQENPKLRPTMSMVTVWLSGKSNILELPIRPTFLDYNSITAPTGEFYHQVTSTSSSSSQSYGGQFSRISGVQYLSEIVDPR